MDATATDLALGGMETMLLELLRRVPAKRKIATRCQETQCNLSEWETVEEITFPEPPAELVRAAEAPSPGNKEGDEDDEGTFSKRARLRRLQRVTAHYDGPPLYINRPLLEEEDMKMAAEKADLGEGTQDFVMNCLRELYSYKRPVKGNTDGGVGKPMSRVRRIRHQLMLVKAIIFLNRPPAHKNTRWPTDRPIFRKAIDLGSFISAQKNLILDYYTFAGTYKGNQKLFEKKADSQPPRVLDATDNSKPRSRKNVVLSWTPVFKFDE